MTERNLIEYRVDQGIALLTLNDPPANTYSYEMMRQLEARILEARMDESVQVMQLKDGRRFEQYSIGRYLDDQPMRAWSFRDVTARLTAEEALRDYREWSQRLATPALLPFAQRVCELLSQNRLAFSRWLLGRSSREIEKQ